MSHLDTEAGVQVPELDADRSAAGDGHTRRKLAERGRLTVGPAPRLLEPGDRRDVRITAGCDDDAVGRHRMARDLDPATSPAGPMPITTALNRSLNVRVFSQVGGLVGWVMRS